MMAVTQELQGLEALEYQMSRNLESLREKREAAIFASTFRGRIFHVAGTLFAVYCIIRIISVSSWSFCICSDMTHRLTHNIAVSLQCHFPSVKTLLFVNKLPRHDNGPPRILHLKVS